MLGDLHAAAEAQCARVTKAPDRVGKAAFEQPTCSDPGGRRREGGGGGGAVDSCALLTRGVSTIGIKRGR